MLFFRRPKSVPVFRRPVMIEGLEGRQLLSASFFSAGGAADSPVAVHAHVAHLRIGGTVVSVDTAASTITVSSLSQGETTTTTYSVDSAATITANGQAVTLADLVAGVKVAMKVDADDPTTVTAIRAITNQVVGVVSAVDTTAGTVTLTTKHGSVSTTFTIPSDATVTVNRAAGTLGDITVGSTARIIFSALNGTKIISVAAHTRTAKPSSISSNSAAGTLVSTDATAGTITVAEGSSSSATQTTYTLSSDATITADGATATLGQLSPGANVKLTLSAAASTTVTAVVATGKKVTGAVTAVDTSASTIMLTPDDGSASATYTIPSTAPITIDGASSTLADVAVGAVVKIQFSALDSSVVVSVTNDTHPHGSCPSDHGEPDDRFGFRFAFRGGRRF